MNTQRGHSAGVKRRTAAGKTITGPQPRQLEIGDEAILASMVSIMEVYAQRALVSANGDWHAGDLKSLRILRL